MDYLFHFKMTLSGRDVIVFVHSVMPAEPEVGITKPFPDEVSIFSADGKHIEPPSEDDVILAMEKGAEVMEQLEGAHGYH